MAARPNEAAVAHTSLKLDRSQSSRFARFLSDLPAVPGLLRFFDRRDYYSVHGDSALVLARDFFKTNAVVKFLEISASAGHKRKAIESLGMSDKTTSSGVRRIPYVCVSAANFEALIKTYLLERGGRIEIYSQSGQNWVLSKEGSPGNLAAFEDVLFSSGEVVAAPSAVAVHLGNSEVSGALSVGFGYVVSTSLELGVGCVTDDVHFYALESALVQLNAKEVIVRSGATPELIKLRTMLNRMDIAVKEAKRSEFSSSDLEGDLRKLLRSECAYPATVLSGNHFGSAALGALVKILGLLSREQNLGAFMFREFSSESFMSLDSAAIQALGVLPPPGVGASAPAYSSLFALLKRTGTAMGSRQLLQWLRQPLVDANEIRNRLNVVELFHDDPVVRGLVRADYLRRIPDIDRLNKRLLVRRSRLLDLVKLYNAVVMLPSLLTSLTSLVDSESNRARYGHVEGECSCCCCLVQSTVLDPIQRSLDSLSRYVQLIEQTIDLDSAGHEVLIHPEFDEELKRLAGKKSQIFDRIRVLHGRAADDLGTDRDRVKLERTSQMGHFFRVTRRDARLIEQSGGLYVSLETRKDGVKFTNDRLRKLSVGFENYQKAYIQRQKYLEEKTVEVASSYCRVFESLAEALARLDVLVAFAEVASDAPGTYCKPEILPLGTGVTSIQGGRHPCVERISGINFIANDVRIVPGEQKFLIITGPNMGGKSTFIRQVALIHLMAQIGCFVPAETAQISICDKILTRVGAQDCLAKGISTFLFEMLETAHILKCATPNSLIIIDELGRGTSTFDGFGLAWAVAEEIVRIGSSCLFATHFHELTSMANEQPDSVANYHVSAKTEDSSLVLLYRVCPGACDKSFGLQVAELSGFPEEVLDYARAKAQVLEDFDNVRSPTMMDTESSGAEFEGLSSILRRFVDVFDKDLSSEQASALAGGFVTDLEASGDPLSLNLVAAIRDRMS